jgi:superfamily II DNA or RNA helicase
VLITLLDNHKIQLSQVFPQQEEVFVKHFSVRDPKAIYSRSAIRGGGGWDGVWRKYNKNNQTLRRPFLAELVQLCKENNFPYEIIDSREKSKYPRPSVGSFDNALIDGIELRENQIDALNAVSMSGDVEKDLISETGMIHHATGSGKTESLAGIIKLFRCPTVIITEQVVVLDQIMKRIILRNVVHNNDIGLFTSGFTPDNNLVIVGSIQALQTPVKPKWAEFNIRLSTIESDFKKLMLSDYEKAVDSIGKANANHWFKSIMIDKFKTKFIKDNLIFKNYVDWTKESDWNDITFVDVVLNNKELLNLLDKNERELFSIDISVLNKNERGLFNVNASGDFSKYVEKAIQIFQPIVKTKYFDIAMKGYHSRFAKSELIQRLVNKCEMLMIDEADKGSSKYYEPLFNNWFNGRYIYGFSATPYDKDKPVEKLLLRERFGSILSIANRKDMTEIGAIQPIKFYMIQHGKEDPLDKTAFDIAEKREIIENEEFHKKIISIINSFPNENFLILVDTAAVEILGDILESKIPGSVFISGTTIRSKRNIALKNFEEKKLRILIGSKIVKRGLDLQGGADNVIMLGAGKKESNIDQIIGRAVRKTKRGWSRVFAFYMTGNYYLLTHSRRQLKFMIGLKEYPITVVYGGKQVPGDHFVKKRYNIRLC